MINGAQGLNSCALDRSPPGVPNKLVSGQQGSLQHAAAGATVTAQHTKEQHDPLQQQLQQQQQQQCALSGEASLPGTQLIGAHGDKESYQGPLGGTVTVPKKCTPLWRAAFYGNVPTQWWLDRNSSSSMAAADMNGAKAVDPDTSKNGSSSTSHRCTISSWSDLVAQSAYIQQAFRPAGVSSPQLRWQHGLLLFGKEAKLGSSRAHSPCPRPAVNRLATTSMRGRVLALEQLVLNRPIRASQASVTYVQRRRQSAASMQAQQQPLQQQCSSSQRRYSLRSHHWVAAADIRARRRGWRPVSVHSSTSDSSSSAGDAPVVLQNDIVPHVWGPDMERQAQQYAAVAGVVSSCHAERDHQGRVVALPQGCIGAGCRASSSWKWSTSGADSGQQQQDVCILSGTDTLQQGSRRTGKCSAGCDAHGAAGRTRHRTTDRAAAAAAAAGGASDQESATTPAKVAEQCRQQQLNVGNKNSSSCIPAADSGAQCVHGSTCGSSDNSDPGIQRLEDALRLSGVPLFFTAAVQDVAPSDTEEQHSDSDWDSDADDDNVYDSDSDVDDQGTALNMGDMEEVDLPVELKAAIAEPHRFRNSRDIIYGFWSKCPLG